MTSPPLETPCDLCGDTGVVEVGENSEIATWCCRPGCWERQRERDALSEPSDD